MSDFQQPRLDGANVVAGDAANLQTQDETSARLQGAHNPFGDPDPVVSAMIEQHDAEVIEDAAEVQPVQQIARPVARQNNNSGKVDELSLAVRNSRRVIAPPPARPEPPGKYCLEYEYNGQAIRETHRSIPHALSRMAALKRVGIVPATSTAG